MKRINKIIVFLTLVLILSNVFVACSGSACEHEFRYTIIKSATCLEKGEMEGICSKCGVKEYQEIDKTTHNYTWVTTPSTCTEEGSASGTCSVCGSTTTSVINPLGHNFINGYCSICGNKENPTYLPAGTELGFTLDEIGELAEEYGVIDSASEFVDYIFNSRIGLCVKGNNILFDVNGYSFLYGIEKVDCDYANGVTDNVDSLLINYSNKLNATYVDGTIVGVGFLPDDNLNRINNLKSIAVNKSNELLVVFEDNEVLKLGTLLDAPADVDESVLIYEKISGKQEYAVIGSMNKDIQALVIPKTHRGLPVTKIKNSAFQHYDTLTSVTMGENVKTIEVYAFSYCNNLSSITLNKNLKTIGYYAFISNSNLTSVTYLGNQQDFQNLVVDNGNDTLTNANWTIVG